jgi:hypothetical protein
MTHASTQTASALASSTERTRRFRERSKADGWEIITLRVPSHRVEEARAFAKSLGEPLPPNNPAQGRLFGDA